MNGLALCAAFGGIERGIESILPDYSTVCYVEGETYPVAVLIEKMERGRIHPAPIWSDVRTFDGSRWRGSVDIITGGFPCQPHSKAGKLRGKDDPRNLWPDVVRIISEVRPRIIFMENVANINNTYGAEIIGDLAKMGFDAAWCVVRASDVGAPHRRARWFLLAYPHDSAEYVMSVYGSLTSPQEYEQVIHDAYPNRGGFSKIKQRIHGGQSDFIGICHKSKHWEVEPRLARLVDGVANWTHRVRGAGNGVVPQQAAYAFQILAERLACGIDANLDPKGC